MNWLVNASSEARWPRPGVSLGVSTAMLLIVPSSFSSRRTVTSPPKPFAVAVFSPSAPACSGSASGSASGVSPFSSAMASVILSSAVCRQLSDILELWAPSEFST